MKKIILITLLTILVSCDNIGAKSFGGTMKINLKPNKKLVTATWEGSDLWYLTRDMRKDEKADRYEFKENSTFGAMEGTVIFIEVKK